ncbi:Voltage-gated ClC-type chloride channel ClcB [Methanolapillus millepedarum]|uniref:Voltage-gated ClC-type chloride channel ClcB n=2 Tax=Methanolapillus millepedarum TaxID=3028296 RepID=A0AA96V3L0_9EURY|nr:Voltage-gated ClC-type chloride channel ClcB [Methanosarcinaceae archaeon Ac7]
MIAFRKSSKKYFTKYYTPNVKTALIAIVIGIVTGVLIGIYSLLLHDLTNTFFGTNSVFEIFGIPSWCIIFIPMLGGLVVGLLNKYFLKTRYGVESVIEAAALHGGKLKARYAIVEAFASVITIGTGGSAGKEAPGVLMGAGVGSFVTKVFNLRGKSLRTYLGCGAAAGISAAFNAPLAGIVFVVEVIYGELEAKTFIPIVISSIFSTFVFNVFFGTDTMSFPNYALLNPFKEIWLFPILGIIAGIVSIFFIKCFYFIRERFTDLKVPGYLKPAIGGLLVGLVGLFYPQVFGLGHNVILEVVNDPFSFSIALLLALVVLKTLAFSFTIGSRGAGGSIVPSMFVGAMLGAAFGMVCELFIPGLTVQPGAYALAGMGAVFAGTSNSTFTAIILLIEMTQDYSMILPFMFACVLSNAIARAANPDSIFTEMLKRKGYTIRGGREVDVMESIVVKDAMRPHVQTVSEDNTIEGLYAVIQSSKHTGFPVVNKNGELTGIVTVKDMQERIEPGNPGSKQFIKDIMTKDVLVAYPFETLDVISDRIVVNDVARLPVVMKSNPKKMVGIITRKDVMNAYNKSILTKVQRVGEEQAKLENEEEMRDEEKTEEIKEKVEEEIDDMKK